MKQLIVLPFLILVYLNGYTQPSFDAINKIMLSKNGAYLSADSVIKNYTFSYSYYMREDRTWIDRQEAIATPAYSYQGSQANFKKNGVFVTSKYGYVYVPTLDLEIIEKATRTFLLITKIDPDNSKIIHVAFRADTLDYETEVGHIDLKTSDFYFNNDTLIKRWTVAKSISNEEAKLLIEKNKFNVDTLCNGIKYPAKKSTVVSLNNNASLTDSLTFILVFDAPKKYSKELIEHSIRYLPEKELDMDPAIEFTFTYSGRVSKKVKSKILLITIPPVFEKATYQVLFKETRGKGIRGRYLRCDKYLEIK